MPIGENSHTILSYRVGGDEFVTVLLDHRKEETSAFCHRLITHMKEIHIPHTKNPHGYATLSVGAGIAPMPIDKESLYECADKALYVAKSKGRNRYEVLKCTPSH